MKKNADGTFELIPNCELQKLLKSQVKNKKNE